VIDEIQKLMTSLNVIPGIAKLKANALFQEANSNSTWLFRIYLQQLLSAK
jgi:hypothetical protein